MCLNPCFDGWWYRSRKKKIPVPMKKGLNPCFDGWWYRRKFPVYLRHN